MAIGKLIRFTGSVETILDSLFDELCRLAWDESNLTLHEIERETQAARMKIDEPKTPFVRSASLGPMDEDTGVCRSQLLGVIYGS